MEKETKLCRDCKYVVMPHPLQAMYLGGKYYPIPMCAHPDAKRSLVDGSLETSCAVARGEKGNATHLTNCWSDARLFEEAPPPPPPGKVVFVEEKKVSWFNRIFGG